MTVMLLNWQILHHKNGYGWVKESYPDSLLVLFEMAYSLFLPFISD